MGGDLLMGQAILRGRDLSMGRSPAGADQPALRKAGAGARTSRPRARSDGGFTTAETAVALPSLVLVALMLAWVLALVTAQLQCVDAARAGARAVSRGESTAASEAAALSAAPDGAVVEIRRTGDFIEVRVSADIRPAGGLVGFLPTATVDGVAHAIAEDAVAPGALPAGWTDPRQPYDDRDRPPADSEQLSEHRSSDGQPPPSGRTVAGPGP